MRHLIDIVAQLFINITTQSPGARIIEKAPPQPYDADMDATAAVETRKPLLEMPGLLSGPENFGLDNETVNRAKARYFDSPLAVTLHETDSSKLSMLGDGNSEGAIGLVSKIDRKLYYYVKYEAMALPLTGRIVTQVELWRHLGADEFFPHVTTHVFYNVLMPLHGAIMSDSLQTAAGRNFWLRTIAGAKGKGFEISLADLGTGVIEVYDSAKTPVIAEWLAQADPWGPPSTHKRKRLIIRQRAA